MASTEYMNLSHDLSGAMSKNRFRNEMLWGLSLIFESFIANKEFVAVFDYICDIELHTDGTFAFYQLKTSSGTSPYSLRKLTKCDKKLKEGHSILGKIFLINNSCSEKTDNLKVAIVSNVPIKIKGKTYTNSPELCIGTLGEDIVKEFSSNLKDEFPDISQFDFSSVFYILSTIDLFNPQDTLVGKTVAFYNNVTGHEPTKPLTLYRAFSDLISNCACYEMEINSYEDLVRKKGVTTAQVSNIIKQYSEKTNDSVGKCRSYIENLFCNDFTSNVKSKRALEQLVIDLQTSIFLQAKEQEVQKWLMQNTDQLLGSKAEIADKLIKSEMFNFSVEYNKIQRWVFVILILVRIEEGVYEESNY